MAGELSRRHDLDRWIGLALVIGLCIVGLLRRIW
jgi:hypothetical protein